MTTDKKDKKENKNSGKSEGKTSRKEVEERIEYELKIIKNKECIVPIQTGSLSLLFEILSIISLAALLVNAVIIISS